LAHVFLSEPDIEFRLGNLLADLVKGRDRAGMSPGFLRGVKCHQAIDAFTDYHPVVHRSQARISDGYRRFSGILVDVFYDHFLALNWERYSSETLDAFTGRLAAEIRAHPMELPEEARYALGRMLEDNRLTAYRTIEGIEATLHRVSQRLEARIGRAFALEKAVSELQENFEGLGSDFAEFFPLLQAYVGSLSAVVPRPGG
jgi:acyl carrier protein phosphodiesterase